MRLSVVALAVGVICSGAMAMACPYSGGVYAFTKSDRVPGQRFQFASDCSHVDFWTNPEERGRAALEARPKGWIAKDGPWTLTFRPNGRELVIRNRKYNETVERRLHQLK